MHKQKDTRIDWILLVGLILFTNQAILSMKLIGLFSLYLLRFNFKFGLFSNRLPKFYLFIVLLSTINFLFFIRDFSKEHITAFLIGNSVWIFSFLALHQIKLSIERFGAPALHRTMKAFMIIHFLLCIGQLLKVMIITGTIDPYNITLPFPYGMSTGDNIHGTFFEGSYYNLVLSGMLAIYFLFRKDYTYMLMASTCLILIFGNFGTIVFFCILTGLLLTSLFNNLTNKKYSIINNLAPPKNFGLRMAGILSYTFLLYIVVSPDNARYVADKVAEKIYAVKTTGKNNYRTIIADQTLDPLAFERFPGDYLSERLQDYKTQKSVYFSDTKGIDATAGGRNAIEVKREMTRNYLQMLQGKSLSVLETIQHLKSSPQVLLFGAGTAHFSSRAAQQIGGLDSSRLFMSLPRYVAPEYAQNHFLIMEERLKSSSELHSTANWADSFYNQLFGEYGLIGALIFVFFYIGFFLKQFNRLSYGFWLMVMLIPFAHLSYVFDMISFMPYFELLLLLNIEDKMEPYATAR